jgi:Tfp pilus assembly protein PilZ
MLLDGALRTLELAFARPEALRHEYETNLANGGVFIATDEPFELREKVRVRLVLAFCHQRLELGGEIVHRVTAEMAALGRSPPGVAISFEEPAAKIRQRLAPLLESAVELPVDALPPGQKPRSPRAAARVAARIKGTAAPVAGRTRNLSHTGALVSVPGHGVPVGEHVKVTLTHPTSGHTMDVDGTVVREIADESRIDAVAIRFDPSASRRGDVESFIDGVKNAEHARRLGGISGDVAELGVPQLVQMLGSTARVGTLTLRRAAEEAVICFERGMVRYVRSGSATGMKALVRLVAWRDGSFEFHARLDPAETSEPPLPLEGAILDATLMHDELGRPGRRIPAPDAVPRLAPAAAPSAGADLGKLERAVLDLVQAGFPVRRMLDVIPEPDPLILGALEALIDAGLVRL